MAEKKFSLKKASYDNLKNNRNKTWERKFVRGRLRVVRTLIFKILKPSLIYTGVIHIPVNDNYISIIGLNINLYYILKGMHIAVSWDCVAVSNSVRVGCSVTECMCGRDIPL